MNILESLFFHEQAVDTSGMHLGFLLASGIGYIGVGIMAFGSFKNGWMFLLSTLEGKNHLPIIRIDLGKHLALGLEFLVAMDIIESIIRPTWDDLGKLAVIVILRTFVTIFLTKEMEVAKEELENMHKHQELMLKQIRNRKKAA